MNASKSTPKITSTRGHVGRTGGERLESWTEPVPDVREEHDHQHDDHANDRDRKHRGLERLHVRLERGEIDLALAAAVVDHGQISSLGVPGRGADPAGA